MFHVLLNNPINKKIDPPEKKPKVVKDRGGRGGIDRFQIFGGTLYSMCKPISHVSNRGGG